MSRHRNKEEDDEDEGPIEIALVGDLTDQESDICDKLLEVEPGEECTLYFNSPGGGAYGAVSLLTMMTMRKIQATGIVTGECSSAALWPLAACVKRIVTPYSVLLFHPVKWQSEENVATEEAAEWSRHFGQLERDMDRLLADMLGMDLAQLEQWMKPGRYISGPEFAEAGLAELVEITPVGKR